MLFKFLPIVALASTVIADATVVLHALSLISNDTLKLQNTITTWKGDLPGTFPIIAASLGLINDLNSQTKAVNASGPLDVNDVIAIIGPAQDLVTDVHTALAAATAAKNKFGKLLLGPVIKADLQQTQTAADNFKAAVISKVPSDFQQTAADITAPIDVDFKNAINSYNGVL